MLFGLHHRLASLSLLVSFSSLRVVENSEQAFVWLTQREHNIPCLTG
jgi:hypothetical protein